MILHKTTRDRIKLYSELKSQGYSITEIARIMGISKQAIHQMYSRLQNNKKGE